MPVLPKQPDIFPHDLLERDRPRVERWWVAYTISRREKKLMSALFERGIGYYAPLIPQKKRTPRGRVITSHLPLFSNYVFFRGGESERVFSLTTNCVSRLNPIEDAESLENDLRRVRELQTRTPELEPVSRLQEGRWVQVISGPLKGLTGTVVENRGEHHLVIMVDWLQQGVSAKVDAFDVRPIE